MTFLEVHGGACAPDSGSRSGWDVTSVAETVPKNHALSCCPRLIRFSLRRSRTRTSEDRSPALMSHH
ncbi:hypothetical protein ABBQ32_014094 [Trebouxia sp. C0010 RCD-2024]